MKLSRKDYHALRGLFLMLSATTAQADVKFGIAAEPYPPFTSKDASGKWVDWEIDLMNGVCEQMHENCQIVE
jgi:polar amino acid transport system substrate-binding protein